MVRHRWFTKKEPQVEFCDRCGSVCDAARVRIVNVLARNPEPVCACEFEPALGLAQPTVSHHLKKLAEAGLLEREQRGKWAYYSLSGEALERLAALVEFKEVAV